MKNDKKLLEEAYEKVEEGLVTATLGGVGGAYLANRKLKGGGLGNVEKILDHIQKGIKNWTREDLQTLGNRILELSNKTAA